MEKTKTKSPHHLTAEPRKAPQLKVVSSLLHILLTLQATELFIMYLTKLSQRNGNTDTEVSYSDLASVVQKKDSMEFLHDIIPKKVKYSEYCKLVEDSKDEEDDLF